MVIDHCIDTTLTLWRILLVIDWPYLICWSPTRVTPVILHGPGGSALGLWWGEGGGGGGGGVGGDNHTSVGNPQCDEMEIMVEIKQFVFG